MNWRKIVKVITDGKSQFFFFVLSV